MLRIIALLTMVIDHVGLIFFPQYIIFRIIGRLAFPLFAWGIARGYLHTRNVTKYGERLLFLALISQPIFYFAISSDYLNICFTLLFGLISIYAFDKSKSWFLKIFFPILLAVLAQVLGMEYGAYGVLMILSFFVFKKWPYLILSQAVLVFSFVLLDPTQIINIFAIFSVFLVIFLKKYNYKLNKTIQYLFYPVHLLILYLIYLLTLVRL